MKKPLLTTLVAGAVLAGGLVTAAAQAVSEEPEQVTACVSDKDGSARIVDGLADDDKAKRCDRHERERSWNVEGPPGPAGRDGTSGAWTGQRDIDEVPYPAIFQTYPFLTKQLAAGTYRIDASVFDATNVRCRVEAGEQLLWGGENGADPSGRDIMRVVTLAEPAEVGWHCYASDLVSVDQMQLAILEVTAL